MVRQTPNLASVGFTVLIEILPDQKRVPSGIVGGQHTVAVRVIERGQRLQVGVVGIGGLRRNHQFLM